MKIHIFIKIITSALLMWFTLHCIYITVDGLTDEGRTADLAVIMGSKVNEDGTLSTRLKRRLACGLKLYLNGRVKRLLVSGGLGKEGFMEGDKMRSFLLKSGVPDSVIIVDNHGHNTIATVTNTLRLKDSLNYKNLIIVSQYFHLTRTKMLFRQQHFTAVSSMSPYYFEIRDIYSLLREFIAYYLE
jgi:vancomycin permeability regulator SanA